MKSSLFRSRFARRPGALASRVAHLRLMPFVTPFAACIALALPTAAAAQTARDSAGNARTDSARALDRVIVTAIRGSGRAPIAEKTLGRRAIMQRQFGQDVPMLLQGASPGLTSHTETGTSSGYSYVRLRGIDQTRINITLDGIPLNDMEDQVLYFANMGDLLSNVNSVQIQRGVGTSTNGTASFGGSVNLETTSAAQREAGVDVALQAGSFNSRRLSVGFRSGLLPSRFAIAGRVSAQDIDGYRYNAGIEQRSAFLTAGWFGDRDIVKFTALAGLLRDTLAYYGATREELAVNRRVNPLTSEDRDRFGQRLVALSYTRALDPSRTLSTTVYRNSTGGSYDYYSAPDVYNYGLDYSWYGVTSALHREGARSRLDVGVNANTYARRHRSFLGREQQTLYYDNTGHKQDASGFAKLSTDFDRMRAWADLQVRHARFRYEPDAAAGIGEHSVAWTFVNPKVGLTFDVGNGVSAFASVGQTEREPARNDLMAGADNMDASNVAELGDFTRVKPERVRDVELGITLTRARGTLSANVYSMDFRSNILPIGVPSASGSPLRRNVGGSHRRGVEMDGSMRLARVEFGGNAAWSTNSIHDYTDASLTPAVRYRNVQPLLSPRFTSAQHVRVMPVPALSLGLEGRYQSQSQLDNTGNAALVLPDFYVLDATARYAVGKYALAVRGVNLGDSQRFGSGYASEGVPYFFVLPPRSVYVTLELSF